MSQANLPLFSCHWWYVLTLSIWLKIERSAHIVERLYFDILLLLILR